MTSENSASIRVLLADDHPVLSAGLASLLNRQPDMTVVGEAADAMQCIELAQSLRPAVILLDVSMPGLGVATTIRHLREVTPASRILILTMHEDAAILRQVLDAGAAGYVIKRAVESELLNAIHAVARGEHYVHPAMVHHLLRPPAVEETKTGFTSEKLTPREQEVLRLVALGYTNQQIAVELNISIKTVETHRANLTAKLGVKRRVDLVRQARELGLLDA